MKKYLLPIIIAFIFLAAPARAANLPDIDNPLDNLQVRIPGLQKSQVPVTQKGYKAVWLSDYLVAVYQYAIGVIGVLAVLGIAIGGIMWVLAAGNPSKIGEAKSWITSSILGLVLALTSYLILYIIDERLVRLSALDIAVFSEADLPDKSDYEGGFRIIPDAPASITAITVPMATGTRQIQVNQQIAETVTESLQALHDSGFPVVSVSHFRPSSPRCHGRGLAIDINPRHNYCVDCYDVDGNKVGDFFRPAGAPGAGTDYTANQHSLTEDAVELMKSYGWCWGGDWRSFKDYMHFSMNCSQAECAEMGAYDWSKSVQENHEEHDITYP